MSKMLNKVTFNIILLVILLLSFNTQSVSAQEAKENAKYVDWNADGIELAIGYTKGNVQIVDTLSGKEVQIVDYFDAVKAIAWSPTKPNLLAIGGRYGTNSVSEVILLDRLTGKLETLYKTGDTITALAWSPDGTKLGIVKSPLTMSVTSSDELQIWDISTRKMLISMLSPGVEHKITSIAWSPDSQKIVGGTTNKTAIIWDATTGKELLILTGHKDVIQSVDWSPLGNQIVTTGSTEDDTVRIWNPDSGENLLTFEARSATAKWSPDGHELAIAENRLIRIIEPKSATELLRIESSNLESAIAYSPFGGRLAIGGVEGSKEMPSLFSFSSEAAQIIPVVASTEKLESVTQLCQLESPLSSSLDSKLQENNIQSFSEEISISTEEQIPLGCKADLLAVADALVTNAK